MNSIVPEYTGRYIGSKEGWQDELALVQPQPNGMVKVQFSNLKLPIHLTHGWTWFAETDWECRVDQQGCPYCRNGVSHDNGICPEVRRYR